jgi:hypothetical protein
VFGEVKGPIFIASGYLDLEGRSFASGIQIPAPDAVAFDGQKFDEAHINIGANTFGDGTRNVERTYAV